MSAFESPFFRVPTSEWIASNRSAFAVSDQHPVSPGHTLVVPRRLIATWWETSTDEKADLWSLVDEVKLALDLVHSPDGYNVGFNAGPAAGQTIDHLHLHVIPRFSGDSPDPRGGVRHVIPGLGNYLVPAAVPSPPPMTFQLFDGAKGGYLRAELLRCLVNTAYDRIDLVVSFIMGSGLTVIADHLRDALDRGAEVRILTTDYMHITDHLALARLIDLGDDYPASITTRIFRDPSTSFHPKSYIFWSTTSPMASGFVGSSNLSDSGISSGVEWNVGVRNVEPLLGSFEKLWADSRSAALDRDFLATYRRRLPPSPLPPEAAVVAIEPDPETVTPRPLQVRALEALEQTRFAGHEAGLVSLATGLGKTWLAAFDSTRPAFRSVLFVAHREEILNQSRDVFRRVRPDASLGLFHGEEKQPRADVVFASIQTLTARLSEFAQDNFDYIVVDEFHHASAPSYRRVIDYFQPKFLLGLTATPQRMDGADLLSLCHDNLVFDCSLVEGIRLQELVPFEYWGIRDVVDFTPIPWRSGRFDPDALTAALETQDRAEQAFREWDRRRGKRTLAFCCSITHADFMRNYFAAKGFRAASVHSGPTSAPRRETIQRLRGGQLDVVFSVDVFNEGVDVPEVDTVLLLRPTESPVIFLQQIGRGLRLAEGKKHLCVVDLIGNHRSFLSRPRVLLTLGRDSVPSDQQVLRAMELHDFQLPPGCSVDYDLSLIEMFKVLVGRTSTSVIEEYLRVYLGDEGVRPSAAQTLQAGFNPGLYGASHGGWFGLLASLDLLESDEARISAKHAVTLRAFETESITKSYKLVAIRAMLRDGALRAGSTVEDLARTSRAILLGDPRIAADVQTDEIGDVHTVDDVAWRRFWRKWPLAHLAAEGGSVNKGLFEFAERESTEWFVPNFNVSVEDGPVFDNMVAELIEWRLQRYLLASRSSATGNPVLRLIHNAGKPILMFDRVRYPQIPEGEVEFLANGDTYVGRFVRVAMNVATKLGEPGNALPVLLRGWFGPSAGLPGTSNRVLMAEQQGRWVLEPIGPPAEGSIDGAVVPLFADYAVACGAINAPDPIAERSGWIEIAGESQLDRTMNFVAFARGDSMDGGADPIRTGDPLLFEWTGGVNAAALVGERVIVEHRDSSGTASTLKLLGRSNGGYVLQSTNPSVEPIDANNTMRVVARLVRRLPQGEINGFAGRIGDRLRRSELGALYGMANSPAIERSGYAASGGDAVLLVTLSKEQMEVGKEYVDTFDSPEFFSWSSQSATSPGSKRGREVLDALATGMRLHLWARPRKTIREFEYCGLVVPLSHQGSQPMQVRFRLLTPLSADAWRRFGTPPKAL